MRRRGRESGERPKDVRRVFDLPVSEDVRREMEFHLRSKVEELVAAGWTTQAAEAEAERRFGDARVLAAQCGAIVRRQRRSARRSWRLGTVWQDLRFGARGLVRDPAFAVVGILTLALGIGANTAVFSVIAGVLLKPLPYAEPDGIVTLWELNGSSRPVHVAEPNYVDWRASSRSFEAMAVLSSYSFGGRATVLGGQEPVRRWVAYVGPEFFRVMRVQPVQGRVFTEGEAEAGDPPVVVVSERFWREQLGSNADLGGLVLGIERERFQVAGVLPAGFHYPGETDVWAPGILNNGPSRTAHNWAVIARLRDGVELEDAQREMSAVAARIRLEHGDGVDAVDVRVRRLQDELVGSFRRPLGLLLGAAALVLLIACTNLASTLLARGGARRREFAVRTSLGAERGRLVRQLLTESLLLSVLGGGAGLLVAMISVKVLVAAGPSGLLGGRAIGLDGNVLAFTALLSFTSAIVFGLVPAQRLSHADPGATLRESPRGEAGSMTGRLWSTLVAAEVALAVILLVSAGLLMRSFRHVIEVDPGFDVRGVTTVDLSLPSTLYPDEDAIRAWHARVLPAVRAIPGIEAAAFINHLPLGGASMNGALEIDGLGDAPGPADYRVVSDGYFASLGIPLRAGRDFDALNDRPGTPPAVIVNEAFVRHLLPAGSTAGDAVGRRIRNLRNESWHYGTQEWLTIVGVVGDIRHSGPLTNPEPETYVSAAQRPLRAGVGHLTVRASAQPGLATALRAAIRAVDPNVPIEISTLETRSADTLAQRRFGMFVLAAFAGLAVVLGGIGIYGVVSYTVERRRREMGLRLALGASSGEVVGRTVSRAMLAVAAGLALGVPSGLAATRLMQGLLFGVRTFDPLTLGSVVTVLLAIALLASWVPARRIAAIDPAVTLRSD